MAPLARVKFELEPGEGLGEGVEVSPKTLGGGMDASGSTDSMGVGEGFLEGEGLGEGLGVGVEVGEDVEEGSGEEEGLGDGEGLEPTSGFPDEFDDPGVGFCNTCQLPEPSPYRPNDLPVSTLDP